MFSADRQKNFEMDGLGKKQWKLIGFDSLLALDRTDLEKLKL